MMKRFSILLLFLLTIGLAKAQQIQQFTQYRFSAFSFNPAFAGYDDVFNAMATHRTQWAGITDAPRTYFLGLHAPDASGKMGFGGSLFTDVAGPTRRTGIQGAYSYHIQTGEGAKLSLGLSFGITQFAIDGSQITLRETNDPTLNGSMQSEIKPDASFGVLWYGERFFVGLSAMQLFNNQLDLFPGEEEGRLAVHYYLTGGYTFEISETFDIEPFMLVKYVDPIDPQFDLSARFIYKSNLWLGGTYRTTDAAAVFAGYTIKDYLTLGYSYDITTSDLSNYSNGSHEIFIGVRFGRKQMIEEENK
jgi:type IX secretion system PorP/SprF family membrane protein